MEFYIKHFFNCENWKSGDVIVLLQGGHGFKVSEKISLIEIKQGPYLINKDKKIF